MRAPAMRVPMMRDVSRRSESFVNCLRGMGAAAGIVFCIIAVLCLSMVEGATDPGDGTVPSFSCFISSYFCIMYGGVGNGYPS